MKLSEVRGRLWWLVVNVVTGTHVKHVYHRFTTTVHTDVTVTQMVHTVVKREQITIVDTGTGTAVLIQRLETSWVHKTYDGTNTCTHKTSSCM